LSTTTAPQKSFVTTWLLSLLLGYLGIDRFYLGKVGTGILKLITGGGLGLWYLIDLIIVLAGTQTDKQNRLLAGYQEHKTLAIILSIVFVLLFGFGGIFGVRR
jgi:TM2 domain-containing membrane protein YozV